MKKTTPLLILFLPLFFSLPVFAQTILQTRHVVEHLDTPWEILWGPDGYIWMTERPGKVSRVNPVTGQLTGLLELTDVIEGSERGLMGMALHPNFPANTSVYLAYTYSQGGDTKIKVVRYTYQPDTLIDPAVIFDNIPGNANHDGCRLLTQGDFLFISTGDAQNLATPQDQDSRNGKIIRLNLDGSIPADNPVPGNPYWSKGHRNPQGLVIANGLMYSSEHGPDTDDEVNIIQKKGNYGWPDIKGFCDEPAEQDFCNDSNVIEPIAAWTPTLAVAGTDYYGHTLIPEWQHSLLVTALKAKQLRQLKLHANGDGVIAQQVYFQDEFGRIRDLCISPSGKVYLATSNRDGRGAPIAEDDRIIEVIPAGVGITENQTVIEVFPNPVSASATISIRTARVPDQVMMKNVSGQVVWQERPGEASFKIPLQKTAPGIYVLFLEDKDQVYTRKIIVQ